MYWDERGVRLGKIAPIITSMGCAIPRFVARVVGEELCHPGHEAEACLRASALNRGGEGCPDLRSAIGKTNGCTKSVKEYKPIGARF